MAPNRSRTTAFLATAACLLPFAVVQVTAQTAGPYPSLVYTYTPGTGSVNPSVVAAISSGDAPGAAILNSQGSNTLTSPAPTFPTTATIGPTTASDVLTSFTFTSGTPVEVLSSNTRPFYTASGTINLNTQSSSGAPTQTGAANGKRDLLNFGFGGGRGAGAGAGDGFGQVWGGLVCVAVGLVTGAVML